MDFVDKLEPVKGNAGRKHEVVDVSLKILWRELVELYDGRDAPRPIPRLEHTSHPSLMDSQGRKTALPRDGSRHLIRQKSEHIQLRVGELIDLLPEGGEDDVASTFPTGTRELVDSASAMGTWV